MFFFYFGPSEMKRQGRNPTWDKTIVHAFCDICIREIERGNRPGTHLTREGWRNLLNDLADGQYEKHQLKYRWNLLKKDWNLWKQLLENESGVKWDERKNTVDCSDDWWDEKLKVIPEAKKFRFEGIEPELEEKLDKMFNVIGDLEEYASVPSDADDLDKPRTRKRRKSDRENISCENMPLLFEFNMDKPNTRKTNEPSKRRKSTAIIINSEENSQKLAIIPQNGVVQLNERLKETATSIKQCETKQSNERISNPKEKSKNLDLIPQKNDLIPDLLVTKSTATSIDLYETKELNAGVSNLEGKSEKLALIPKNGKPIPDFVETNCTATSMKHCETPNYSITDAIRLLDSLNEVPKASPLYYFATKLILDKDRREVFMALSKDIKVWWLKMEESESKK